MTEPDDPTHRGREPSRPLAPSTSRTKGRAAASSAAFPSLSPDAGASPESPAPAHDFARESVLSDQVKHPDAIDLPTSEDASSEDTPEIAQVRRLTGSLAKAVKASQLYPADNPMCRKFAEEFQTRLAESFQLMDIVRLSVGKTKLFFAGEPVLAQPGRDESVPGRLFWSGVREIAFHVGLTAEEATSFLGIFRAVVTQADPEQSDIVTLLWDARFEHLTYMAIDDILDLEDTADPIPAEFGQDFMNFVDLEMHDLDDDEAIDQKANEMAEQIRSKFNNEDVALFGVSPQEREALAGEIQAEESPRMLRDIVYMIGETLLLEHDETSFEELVQVLSGTLVALIGEGRLVEAREVIRMFDEVRAGAQEPSPAMRLSLDRGIAAGYDRKRRDILVRHLDTGKRSVLEALDGFVRALPNEAMEACCDILGNLQAAPAQRRLTAALSQRANEDIRPFLPFLRDARSDLVCRVARILGDTKNERALDPLGGLLRHRDPNVRRVALEAMAKLGSGRALDPMIHAVSDPDPRIRITAARNLGQFGRTAVPVLLTFVQADGFDERPLAEKRAFYEALGYAGGEDVLPMVKKALGRRGLLKRGQIDELRACACEALGWIRGPEAEKLLRSAIEDRSVLVRTAAQSALRRLAGEDVADDLGREAA